jgi:hypothetical protein
MLPRWPVGGLARGSPLRPIVVETHGGSVRLVVRIVVLVVAVTGAKKALDELISRYKDRPRPTRTGGPG